MAAIDLVRRECEDLGASLAKADKEARAALGKIHTKAMSDAEPRALLKELDAFRSKFKINPKVASSYRAKE